MCAYRDLDISGGRILGYPELCILPSGSLLVSTWLGFCIEVDWKSEAFEDQPMIGVNTFIPPCLRSPTASTTKPILCCAATSQICTAVWCLGEDQTTQLATTGPINTVLFAPQGDWLALGLEMYPLASRHSPCAVVEIYETANLDEIVARRILPGVAVDKIVHISSRDQLVVLTGARSQNRGHIFLLDLHTCNLVDVAEIEESLCRTAFIDEDAGQLMLVFNGGIQIRFLDDLQSVEWHWPVPEGISCAAYDQKKNWIYLSNGAVLEPGVGEVERIETLKDCSSMVVLPSGLVAGINMMGVLRIWEVRT